MWQTLNYLLEEINSILSKFSSLIFLMKNTVKSFFNLYVSGCLGLENEGWFDPWSLLAGFKEKAVKLGANYVMAEANKFEFEENRSIIVPGVEGTFKRAKTLYVTTKDGKVRPITFSVCIIAAGAQSGKIAEMANIGTGQGLLSIALPVEPR